MKRSAFTLLEVVIVIIIIGVLASLALPKLFSVIEGVKITEALSAISTIRSAMERCYLMNNGSYYTCNFEGFRIHAGVETVIPLDIENPGNAPGAHFFYGVWEWGSYYLIQVIDRNDNDILIFSSNYSFADGTVHDDQSFWYAVPPYKNFVPNAEPL